MEATEKTISENRIKLLRQLKSDLVQKVWLLRQKKRNDKPHPKPSESHYRGNRARLLRLKQLAIRKQLKIVEISRILNGYEFIDSHKEWLHNDIYKYNAIVKLETVVFNIEVLCTIDDSDTCEITNFTVNFIDLNDCFMSEITPWLDKLTKIEYLQVFMSVISDYDSKNITRSNILSKGKIKEYLTYEEESESGGFGIKIYSPKTKKKLLDCQWQLKYSERYLLIQHYFIMTAVEEPYSLEFVEENETFMEQFCVQNINDALLVKLWQSLFSKIDKYKN